MKSIILLLALGALPAFAVGGDVMTVWLLLVAAYGAAVVVSGLVAAVRFRSLRVGALAVPVMVLTNAVHFGGIAFGLAGDRRSRPLGTASTAAEPRQRQERERDQQAIQIDEPDHSPGEIGRWDHHACNGFVHQDIEQFLLVAHVAVQRHRHDAQPVGEAAHGEGGKTSVRKSGRRRLEHRRSGES